MLKNEIKRLAKDRGIIRAQELVLITGLTWPTAKNLLVTDKLDKVWGVTLNSVAVALGVKVDDLYTDTEAQK
jgi:hypothetical protein